ncbi:MAG: EpsG family protein [Candidatus Methanoperedens sp.]|nr:EpsG family protein [Candidatus Methanoperedens sp.]MCE8427750.1 EpsG family protein [Candidatus Methanoperedens sp.]
MNSSAIRTSFNQLLIIYIVLVSLANLETFSKYILHFEIFAIALAVVGVLSLEKRDEIKIPSILMIIPFVIILASRLLPYLNNSVPLGYDPGIYKYIMEGYQQNLPYLPSENIDLWVRKGFEPGLFMITDLLYLIGFDAHAILTWVFIFFELLLGLGIYVAAGRFFGKNVGILSLLIYSISIAQFKVFWYMYYKNVVALFLMLIALYLFRSRKYLPFILTSAFVGAVHRPTFLIFGLIYMAYIITYRKDLIKNVLAGMAVLAIALTFYLSNLKEAILYNIDPIITANIGSGTFISLFTYQFSSLPYLPFALLGFLFLARNKDLNLFFLWFLVGGIIVYFKLIFFDRFIIHLDIAMIILASVGLHELMKFKNRIITALLFILLLSSMLVMYQNINDAKPLVNENELNIIKKMNSLESNAYIMSTSSYYSPWILGYSGRKTVAPGLFDYDKWNFEEWETFRTTVEKEKAVEMLAVYEKPLYIYLGEKKRKNETKFENECFDKIFQENEIKIFKVLC